jgi:hypothetical protein
MAVPFISPAFVTGEVSPSVFGRVDVDRERVGVTTMRNMYVNYRGGANSRAGTAFVGFSKQTGRNFPPRLIPFQFSIDQGLALEFGHHYMRVILNGGYITEPPVAIGNASQGNPAVLTFGAQGAVTATPNNAGVTFSYAPGDLITVAGGIALAPAVLAVTTSELVSMLANNRGSGYGVGDTITLGGGSFTSSAVVTIASLASVAASGSVAFVGNPSDGDTVTLNSVVWTFKTTPTAPAQTQILTTLNATLLQLASDLNASVNALLTVATYGATPTDLTIVYDTGGTAGNAYTLAASVGIPSSGTLTGGTATGVGTVNVTTKGVFTALPGGGLMTQSATSGGGAGASFQTAVFGPHALSISSPGAYSVVPTNPVMQASTTGIGVGATFTMTWAAVPAFANGDWIFITGVQGMTELNGNTYIVAGATPTTVNLLDVYGDTVNSSGFGAYTGGGTASRIFTVATPYDEQDLAYLKFTQSADVMSICCVNQKTRAEYAPQDLARISDTDWVFSPAVAVPSVSPPTGLTASITAGGAEFYQYEVTAVSPADGTESIASNVARVQGVPIFTTQGQVNLKWNAVTNVNSYNIYKAQPSFGSDVPTGSLFGYIGSSYGNGFQDPNILPDFAQVPPRHVNPFARGQIAAVNVVTGGSGYSSSAAASIVTSTGAGAVLQCVVQSGAVVAVIVVDAGHDYAATDTVAITGGTGATATALVGPQSGTYPSVVSYFQERRGYANTLNTTDTYFLSQPGAFKNFDSRIPPIDTDAIVGSPWSVQVNGIQWMVQTSGGLLVMTGLSAWLLVGAGSFATNVQAISPSTQDVVSQSFTGVSPTVVPIKINDDILYVNSKGAYYYALPYQLYVLSEPVDITEASTHLFTNFQILENAWCEQPSKVLWAVRDDGVLLSLTYYKAQQVNGWGRHDTNGQFISLCSITELPIDALYVATKRFIGTHTAYLVERMDDRLWTQVEDCWCVDCGLSLPQPEPNATLTANLPYGLGSLTGVTALVGGAGYSAATTASVVDDNGNGPGTGAVAALTIVAGAITAIAFTSPGAGYVSPRLVITDPANTGSGASARPVLNTAATFTASAAVFASGDVGKVIRMGGGIATITVFNSTTSVVATITTPITDLLPNSAIAPSITGIVRPQDAGEWTMTRPVSLISGLDHLIGATVTGLADGEVITPRVVSAAGTVTLDTPASAVNVGLGFQAQLQGVYLEAGPPTIQGQRKKIAGASALMESSRGVKMGGSQPDGSTLSPPQIAPVWSDLDEIPDQGQIGQPTKPYNSAVVPLYTSYVRIPVGGGFTKTGQVSLQQDNPLPMNINAIVPEAWTGDNPEQQAAPRQRAGG